MKLQMYADYMEERLGYTVVEKDYGFFTYCLIDSVAKNDKKIFFVYDYYLVKDERGWKRNNVQLFNDIKNKAISLKTNHIMGTVHLDSLNGPRVLKLFLLLGFDIVNGNGNEINIGYSLDNSKNVRKK